MKESITKETKKDDAFSYDNAHYHPCPVCGKYYFEYENSFEGCPVCGWLVNKYQEDYPDEDRLANKMSLNQARAAYKAGKPVV